ncbi:unnamed protein product [Cylindrotheca closterium]|uniref:Uncharacterized protein n=1 Tax=Cylindrotheca closterium TaxID=2856 RepID=A0AAD2FPL6_9STRA|nr:unnamed protein product [Cylindrotheca closterium]
MSHRHYPKCLLGFLAIVHPSLAFAPNFQLNSHHHVLLDNSATIEHFRQTIYEGESTATTLYASSPDDISKGDEKDDFDVEAARRKLESMMGTASDETADSKEVSSEGNLSFPSSSLQVLDDLLSSSKTMKTEEDIELPSPPPLSTIERDRRNAEIQLLKELDVTDEASSELWKLWYSERGGTAKKKLEVVDSLMGNPKTWKMTETVLREIIDEYGIYFVEPLNRLATLSYLQGKFDESYKLCLVILKVKPWHFGALSGIVQVCIGKGDRDGARDWAAKRLPNMVAGDSFPPFATDGPKNPRRKKWVDKQVAAAEKQLKKIEQETKRSFGKPDSYVSDEAKGDIGSASESSDSGIQESDDNTGAWM